MDQLRLFAIAPVMPDGFTYHPEVLSRRDEEELGAQIALLELLPFSFHGYTGKRRVCSYGWTYDFEANVARRAGEIPPFLHNRLSACDRREAAATITTPAEARMAPGRGGASGQQNPRRCRSRLLNGRDATNVSDAWSRAPIAAPAPESSGSP